MNWLRSAAVMLAIAMAGCAPSWFGAPQSRVLYSPADLPGGCQPIHVVRDNNMDDLAAKAARKGGTHAVIVSKGYAARGGGGAFGFGEVYAAQVYRCEASS